MDIEDTIMQTVISVLSEKVDPVLLKKANTNELKKKLYKKLVYELFYKILKEKKVNLLSGFGTIRVKEIQGKKKVYDRKSETMTTKDINTIQTRRFY
jgi:nucleoid DNA-binding protein